MAFSKGGLLPGSFAGILGGIGEAMVIVGLDEGVRRYIYSGVLRSCCGHVRVMSDGCLSGQCL